MSSAAERFKYLRPKITILEEPSAPLHIGDPYTPTQIQKRLHLLVKDGIIQPTSDVYSQLRKLLRR